LSNFGDGTFDSPASYPAGDGASGLLLSDVNGDTHTDVIVMNSRSEDMSLFLNNGNGTFKPETRLSIYGYITIEDINHDGLTDLVVCNHDSNYLEVYLNDGTGTFFEGVKYDVGDYPYAPTISDVNNDGFNDLLVPNSGRGFNVKGRYDISVLLGKGDGTFQSQIRFPSGAQPVQLLSSDVNNDGWIDLLKNNRYSNDISVLFNTGLY